MKSFYSLHDGQETVGSGASGAQKVLNGTTVAVAVACTDITGTLDLSVQWSPDGVNWGTAEGSTDTFTQLTATGTVGKVFTVVAPYFRLNWTVGGTDATFVVTATS